MGLAQWATLLMLSVLWGGSFFFVAVALRGLPPLTLVTLRVVLAALALLLVMAAMGIRVPREATAWRVLFVLGFINIAIPFSLIMWGQTHIASGLAAILNAAAPLFAVVVAHVFTADEKMTPGGVSGVVIGMIGVAVMLGPEALERLDANVLAQLAVLGAGIGYALGTVYARLRLRPLGLHPIAAAAGQVATAGVIMLPVALWVERPWTYAMPGLDVWGATLALALGSTALAYVFYFRLLASTGATNILLVTFLIPITSILLGVGILGEVLEPKHFAGMGLVGLGLAAIDGRPLAAIRRRWR